MNLSQNIVTILVILLKDIKPVRHVKCTLNKTYRLYPYTFDLTEPENALPLLSLYQTDIYINIEFGLLKILLVI